MINQFKSDVESETIWVTFSLEGFHRWENAPHEVAYLDQYHRHLFKFKVWARVSHSNRQVEFHTLLKDCKLAMNGYFDEPREESCESIARFLKNSLSDVGYSIFKIEVSEDGECGSETTFTRDYT